MIWHAEDASHVTLERAMLDRALPPGAVVLEAGCGRTSRLNAFRDRIAQLTGVDLDQAGCRNPVLDEFVTADLCDRLPLPDDVFDVVYANFVVEHLSDPERAFSEWRRVLRPAGQVVLVTSNSASPPLALARLMPQQTRVGLKARAGAMEHDVFPAVYRANTPERLRETMGAAGLSCRELCCVGTLHRYASRPAMRAAVSVAESMLPQRLRSTIVARFQAD